MQRDGEAEQRPPRQHGAEHRHDPPRRPRRHHHLLPSSSSALHGRRPTPPLRFTFSFFFPSRVLRGRSRRWPRIYREVGASDDVADRWGPRSEPTGADRWGHRSQRQCYSCRLIHVVPTIHRPLYHGERDSHAPFFRGLVSPVGSSVLFGKFTEVVSD